MLINKGFVVGLVIYKHIEKNGTTSAHNQRLHQKHETAENQKEQHVIHVKNEKQNQYTGKGNSYGDWVACPKRCRIKSGFTHKVCSANRTAVGHF